MQLVHQFTPSTHFTRQYETSRTLHETSKSSDDAVRDIFLRTPFMGSCLFVPFIMDPEPLPRFIIT